MTLVTSDSYVVGALVLGYSLRATGTSRRLLCMTSSGSLSRDSLTALRAVFDNVPEVLHLDSKDVARLRLLGRPELGPTFSKVGVWALPGITKAVFLDADMLVLRNIDDLFSRPELSACPDVGWPDCFNSGLFVCEPNMETYRALLSHASDTGSFDGILIVAKRNANLSLGGDQGLLNSFFADWSTTSDPRRRIPFGYNLTFSGSYGYAPALVHFRESVRAVHFIGPGKPWLYHRDAATGRVIPRPEMAGIPAGPLYLEYVQAWWAFHDQNVMPLLAAFKQAPSFTSFYNVRVLYRWLTVVVVVRTEEGRLLCRPAAEQKPVCGLRSCSLPGQVGSRGRRVFFRKGECRVTRGWEQVGRRAQATPSVAIAPRQREQAAASDACRARLCRGRGGCGCGRGS